MAFQCFLDAFTTASGSSAPIVRTGYGFQPKACLYWWSGRPTAGPIFGRTSLFPGFGMATSSTNRASVTAFSYDGQGTMVTNRRHSNTDCIAQMTLSTSLDQVEGVANLSSFDSDGQTLSITSPFGALRVHCLALGGSDLTDAAVVQFQAPSTSGAQTQDITTVGFQPDAVMFMSAAHNTAPPAITPSAEFAMGVATSTSACGTVTFSDLDGSPSSNTTRYGYGGECLSYFAGAVAPDMRATLDSFLSNGFRLNWLEATATVGNRYVWALCLKGGSFLAGNFVTSTTLNATIVESGFGFAPTGCLLFSTSNVQDTQGVQTSQATLALGAFTSASNRACQSIVSNNSAASAVCGASLNEDACLRMLNNGTTSAGVVDVSAVGSDGFTLIMDAADVTTAKYVTYLAFGDAPAAPGGGQILPQMMQHAA